MATLRGVMRVMHISFTVALLPTRFVYSAIRLYLTYELRTSPSYVLALHLVDGPFSLRHNMALSLLVLHL